MSSTVRSGSAGLIALSALLISPLPAEAETEFTVNGVDVDKAVVDIYVQSRSQKPADQASAAERSGWVRELKDIYLLTTQPRSKELAEEPDIKAQLELQKRGLLAQVAAGDFISRNAATEEEILGAYKDQVEKQPVRQFKARHILVETQAAGNELIEQLDEGADFQELAKANSTGPSGPNGGDLGWFSTDQMVKPFSDAVVELPDGKYSTEPVQTQFGWHVILREDSRETEPPTLDSVRDGIKQRLEQRKLQQYLEGLRATN